MRPRVNERLARAARFPVTIVAASAGFGKSVALRDFIESSRLDAIRVDLRREEGSLLAFVQRLSEALRAIAPGAAASFPAMQERVLAASEPVREIANWFVEHLKSAACTIVIDDLHHAAGDLASIALLADVVERTSDRISWIMAARSDVGLPVASWVAYGRMDLPIGEDDLRFTAAEALASADDSQAAIDPSEIEELRELTGGWPVALSIAMRTRTQASDLRSAAAGTRDMIYRYLAEQILNLLTPRQREFVLQTGVLPSFDAAIAQALGADQVFIDDLRRRVTFLTESDSGVYRYHELFREFLESELRRSGESNWRMALSAGGALMERRRDPAAALALFIRAREPEAIRRVVANDGFSLYERGESDLLLAAIAALPPAAIDADPAALGLRAMLDAARGHFDLAEPAFSAAIARANDSATRLTLVHRYAVELVRNDRDCIDLLEPYAADPSVPASLQIPILGTLATGYAKSGRSESGVRSIERALALSGVDTDDEMRARIYQQAAYVFQFADKARARKYADLSIDLALRTGLYDVAARATSVSFAILYNETSDPVGLLAILDKLGEFARKSASEQTRLYGLIAAYDLEVERGEDAALERLDRELAQSHATLPLASSEMLLPARALRATWSADFHAAYDVLHQAAQQLQSVEWKGAAIAHMALCAFAAGMIEQGEAASREALQSLEQGDPSSMQVIRGRLFLALAELLRGRTSEAHRQQAAAERALSPSMQPLRAFSHAVKTAYRLSLGQAEAREWEASLERLRGVQFGGLARMLEKLPLATASVEGYASLTAAEREILQLVALGASSKDVAAKTGRSAQTVDTHIRSICRKLGCSGRREAVALATRSGWVEP